MAVTSSPVFPQIPQAGQVQIANADAQAQKTVITGGANGTKITALIAVSSDTSARDVQVSRTVSGTSYPLGTVSVPIGAGNTSAAPSINLLNSASLPGIPLDNDGNPYIFLKSGETLTVSALTTVTAAKLITVQGIGADF